MMAYAFARFSFHGRTVLFGLLLLGLMVPAMMMLIPQFLLAKRLMLLDSLWGLVVRAWWEDHVRRKTEPNHRWTYIDFAGGNSSFPASLFHSFGGFDEDFFCYLEDLDLGVRGQLTGWKCWYVPSTLVRHKKSATAGNYSIFKAYHVERNRLFCLWKWMPRYLVFVSPLFTLNRYAMQAYAVHTHQGLSAEFVKEYSAARLFLLPRLFLLGVGGLFGAEWADGHTLLRWLVGAGGLHCPIIGRTIIARFPSPS